MKARVLTPISHDGQSYSKGDTFEGPESVVKVLIDAGAVRLAGVENKTNTIKGAVKKTATKADNKPK
jgi:hypothetical protein